MSENRVPVEPGRAADASMSLLADLMSNTLDAGYAEAAARRVGGGDGAGRHPRSRGIALFTGLVLIGGLLAAAAAEARDRGGAANGARLALVAEVTRRSTAADRAAADLVGLRQQIAKARRDALALDGEAAASAVLDRLDRSTGAIAVTGPGLVVTVDAASRPSDGTTTASPRAEDRVLDRDLQALVNGLWAAGAEAITINGQRLTTLSAIRSADVAILVDYRPLLPPYVVRAIGAPRTLEPAFADSSGGRDWRLLADNYGFRFEVASKDDIALPAAEGLTLRVAHAPTAGGTGR